MTRSLLAALVLLAVACNGAGGTAGPPGDDPNPESYAVALDRCHSRNPAAGVMETTCTLRVTRRGGSAAVAGAAVRYQVDVGTLAAATATSGADGLATAVWTVTAAEIAHRQNGTLSACAMNVDPPTCSPEPVWVQPF